MRKQTASSFSSIELLLSLHYSPVFEMTFDLGRCSTYVNSSGEVVEKYAMEDEKNWLAPKCRHVKSNSEKSHAVQFRGKARCERVATRA